MKPFVNLLAAFAMGTALLFGQSGDRKDASKMQEVVPTDQIPPSPILTPEEALEAITIQDGFEITLFASEPMINKPVSLHFDAQGRAWIAEMVDYMKDIDGKGEGDKTGRIVCLEDTDGDGKADKSTAVLEGLENPRLAVIAYGGLLFSDGAALKFTKINGLTPTGEIQVIDEKYAPSGNIEHRPNGMMRGIDNAFYNAKSQTRYAFDGKDWSSSKTLMRGQWGISHDDWGFVFHNHNSTWGIADRVLPQILMHHPAMKAPGKVGQQLRNPRVYPSRVTPGMNRGYMTKDRGFNSNTLDEEGKLVQPTGTCAPTVYRGNQFPEKFKNTLFVAESAAMLVSAISFERNGAKLKPSPTFNKSEFLTSMSERFRPVAINNGPDGALYITDLAHGMIQDKHYMTTYLRNQYTSRGLDKPGQGFGRIYRITHKNGAETTRTLPEKVSLEKCVELLSHDNGWVRDRAQQRLVEAGKKAPYAKLRTVARNEKNPLAQMHALRTLAGMRALDGKSLTAGLTSKIPELRYHALELAGLFPDPSAFDAVVACEVPSGFLHGKAFALASYHSERATAELTKLLKDSKAPYLAEAAFSGSLGSEENLEAVFTASNRLDKNWKERFKKAAELQANGGKEVELLPDLAEADLASFKSGKALFENNCAACHGPDGDGLPSSGPPLNGSEWVTGEHGILSRILLYGLAGPVRVDGVTYEPAQVMPGLKDNPSLTDQHLADIATYIRNAWDNSASPMPASEISRARASDSQRDQPFTALELNPAQARPVITGSALPDPATREDGPILGLSNTGLLGILVFLGLCISPVLFSRGDS